MFSNRQISKVDYYWSRSYRQLLFYLRVQGEYPPELHPLNNWCEIQRKRFETKTLRPGQKILLENLPNWIWYHDWDKNYKKVERYLSIYDNGLPTIETSPVLGRWCENQRKFKNFLTEQQKRKLKSLPGWSWESAREVAWMKNYLKVLDYVKLTKKYPSDECYMGQWIKYQRANIPSLTPNQIQFLIAIPGWVW